jgi:hypothetical protein
MAKKAHEQSRAFIEQDAVEVAEEVMDFTAPPENPFEE